MKHSIQHRGISLVELLIVIAIIGLLVQLTIPAVQMARESARRASCANNLRQIGIGVQLHESALRHYPAGGWGYLYVGDPDRGAGKEQPGGWIYNTFPYVEQSSLHDLGKGLTGDEKLAATGEMLGTPISIFNCPSRRSSRAYPFYNENLGYVNYQPPEMVGKSDYAGNGGDVYTEETRHNEGPPSYAAADADQESQEYWMDTEILTGIFYQRSDIEPQQVTDGLSKTYLVGEKYVDAAWYDVLNTSGGDDQCMYLGADEDVIRFAAHHDGRDMRPRLDQMNTIHNEGFGSAHAAGCYFVFCDGSVRLVSYDLDEQVHRRQANRHDQEVVKAD